MMKRFFSFILAVIMFIFGSLPVKANSHDYDIIDYVTDGTITNVVSSYANMLYNQFPKPSDVIDIIGGNSNDYTQRKQDSVNDFANSLIVNSDNLRTAIENGYVDLDGRAKEIWNNLFNNHRGKNLVFSPDIGDMDFIRPLIDRVVNYRVLDNDRGGYPDISNPPVDSLPIYISGSIPIKFSDLESFVESGNLASISHFPQEYISYILNAFSSTHNSALSLRLIGHYRPRYIYLVYGTVNGNSFCFSTSTNADIGFTYNFINSSNVYRYGFVVLNDYEPRVDGRYFFAGLYNTFLDDGSVRHFSHTYGFEYSPINPNEFIAICSSAYGFIDSYEPDISLDIVKYSVIYNDSDAINTIVNNTVNNFYENIENIYNTDIVNNYYPSEIFIPSVDNGSVINHNDNSLNIDLSKNNDITNIVNNYVYNNYYSYGGDTHNNNYTYVTNIESILPPDPPTDPTDPAKPTPNEPDPTDPEDPEDGEDDKDGWPDWFKKIIEFLRGIFDIDILDWLKSLLDSILEFLKLLFLPEEGFLENEIAKMYSNLLLSLPLDGQLNVLMSLAGNDSINVSVSDYNIFSDSEKINYASEVLNISSMSSSAAFEDITITFMGNEITFISSAFINQYIDTIRSFTGGILTLIMLAYNLDQIHLFFRNTRLFNPSKGIDTSGSGRRD